MILNLIGSVNQVDMSGGSKAGMQVADISQEIRNRNTGTGGQDTSGQNCKLAKGKGW